jgi:hypothetical protein
VVGAAPVFAFTSRVGVVGVVNGPTRKLWTPATLAELDVALAHDGRFVFHVRDATGAPRGVVRYADDGRKPKMLADDGMTRDLWPRPEDTPGPELDVCEGEPDAVSLRELGRPGVGIPGVGKDDVTWPHRLAIGRKRVNLWCDCDEAGRRRMRVLAARIAALGVPTYVVELDAGRTDKFDVGDLLAAHGAAAARRIVADLLDKAERVDDGADNFRGARDRIIDMKLAFLTADAPLPYRVDPLVVDGTVTVLAGRRGEHKSWLAIVMCAGVRAGIDQGPLSCATGPAVYVDAEMGAKQMARRLRLLGLGHDAFVAVDGFGLRLPRDMHVIRELVTITGARLLVLDSFRRLAPDAKEDKSDDVTPVMVALAELARDTDVAIVLIHHRSAKAGAPDTRGSSAIEDQADAVWVLEKIAGDPEHKTRRQLRNAKQRLDEERDPLWLDFKVRDDYMTMAEAEPFASHETPSGDTRERVADVLMSRMEALRDRVLADGNWPMAKLAAAVGREVNDRAFRDARDLLLASGHWVAGGSTRNRWICPVSDSSSQADPLEGWPDDWNQDNDPEDDPEGGST